MMMPAQATSDLEPLLRAVRGLLVLIACLLAVLVLGLGAGAWIAVRHVSHLEDLALAQAAEARRLAEGLGAEATHRQATLGTGLTGQSRATQERYQALAKRRQGLGGHPPNPLAKLDQVIDLNALVADELLLLLRHTVETQDRVGKSLKPLPTQKELTRPGSAP